MVSKIHWFSIDSKDKEVVESVPHIMRPVQKETKEAFA